MRLLIAALALTFTVAVVASVFAIWSGVADAPWEDSEAAEVCGTLDEWRRAARELDIEMREMTCSDVFRVRDQHEIRCTAALSFRETLIEQGYRPASNTVGDAEREIDRYC